jgi:hypothetical protein
LYFRQAAMTQNLLLAVALIMSQLSELQKELDNLKIYVTKQVNELRSRYFMSSDGLRLMQSNNDSEFVIWFAIDVGLLKNQD